MPQRIISQKIAFLRCSCYTESMKTLSRYLSRRVNRVALGLWMFVVATGLSGCSFAPQIAKTPIERLDFHTAPSQESGVNQGLSEEDYDPKAKKNPAKLGLSADESKALGCSIADRFDRDAALAYNFSNQQSRLALHLDMRGGGLQDIGRMDVEAVMVRFTHKLQKSSADKKQKCRFNSKVQGLVGSVYNEFFVRDNYTVWQELRHRLNISQ
jgi:hypothetical protein